MKQVAAIFHRSLILSLCLALAIPTFAQRGGGGGGRGGGGAGGGGGRPGAGGGGNMGNPGGGPRGPGAGGNPYNLGPPPASARVNTSVPGYGFGSALFPGGSTSFGSYGSPIYSTMGPLNNTFASTLGRVVGGVSPTSGFIGGNNRPGRGGVYPVPVFVGGGYGYGYGYGYQDAPQVTVINQQPAVPSVIINQGYEPDAPARPVMRVYGEGVTNTGVNTIQIPSPSYPEGNPLRPGAIEFASSTSAAPAAVSDEPNVYMIALRDGTIYASYAYWAERDMLHYITPGHAHNQVSMDRVDLTLTRRLNRERNLDFSLR